MKIRDILAHPTVFRLFNTAIGMDHSRRLLTKNYIKPSAGDKIFDIGCGMAEIVEYFPPVAYHGFDISTAYIEKAGKLHGPKAVLHNAKFSAEQAQLLGPFDIGIAIGLLHHLSDIEARQLLQLAYDALKPGGRLITSDGCYTETQSSITRYLLSHDRGEFVREEQGYVTLIASVFKDFRYDIRRDLLRIPYTHIIFECRKPL